jgi:HSP20 family protein
MITQLIPLNTRAGTLFDAFRREMDDVVGRLQEWNPREGSTWFSPRTNVAETEKAYELTVDLPGLAPDDFSVELQDGHLTITGTRKEETEEKGKTYHRVERLHGEFRRSFSLGRDIDADKVEAQYKDGVLRIVVPKAEEVRPKKIDVKNVS